jgi:hypothetical protein
MRVAWLLASLSAALGGCGLADSGAAATAGGSVSAAEQAAAARQAQERIRQQIESANQQALERERAAADAAAR